MMQQEIIQVIRKYVTIADDQVSVQLDNNDDCSVLELNVTLPDNNN
jgi:cell division topological specificity factor